MICDKIWVEIYLRSILWESHLHQHFNIWRHGDLKKISSTIWKSGIKIRDLCMLSLLTSFQLTSIIGQNDIISQLMLQNYHIINNGKKL